MCGMGIGIIQDATVLSTAQRKLERRRSWIAFKREDGVFMTRDFYMTFLHADNVIAKSPAVPSGLMKCGGKSRL